MLSTEFQTPFLISLKSSFYVTEIQSIFGMKFYQTIDLTFIASEFEILFLQYRSKVSKVRLPGIKTRAWQRRERKRWK